MSYLFARADAARLPLASKSVRITIGSPPYCDARTYGIGAQRKVDEWIDWMLLVTAEALRVSSNCVIWVAAGVTRDRNYWSACEGLMDAWRRRQVPSGVWQDGIELPGEAGSMYRPVYWHRVGIPGSGHDDWFRADVEMCMCFKRPGRLPFADNTACGHPPKWAPGGEMSNRVKDGHRRNQWGRHENCQRSQRNADGEYQGGGRPSHVFGVAHTRRMKGKGHEAGDEMETQYYVPPVLSNPGNFLAIDEDLGSSVLHTNVGGGQMGHALAHANEAPYPTSVPEFFIKSLTAPGDVVCDPFSGSGSTAEACVRNGRHCIGFDLRESQCGIARRRLSRPHAPVAKPSREPSSMPLFSGILD